MRALYCAVTLVITTITALPAIAGGIEPGLWKVVTRSESGVIVSPPHESTKCLTAEQTNDLGATFSPIPTTINSECAPIERSLNGPLLTWHLVCKGQLNMELSGEFKFDSPQHYTGTIHTKAEMQGMAMVDSRSTVEGRWVSACPR